MWSKGIELPDKLLTIGAVTELADALKAERARAEAAEAKLATVKEETLREAAQTVSSMFNSCGDHWLEDAADAILSLIPNG